MKTLKEQIREDFMTSFKAKDFETKNFLGTIKGAIETEEKNVGSELNDGQVMDILKKFVKNIHKTLEVTESEQARTELSIIEGYLPEQLSEEEITNVIDTLIADGAKHIGMIMGTFGKEYKGKVDMALAKKIAETKL